MKYVSFFILILTLLSCGSRKQIVEKNPEEVLKMGKDVDNIAEVVNDSTEKNEPILKTNSEESLETNNGFHQSLSKRFLPFHQLWDELLQKHVSNVGIVNYKSFKTDHKKLLDYIYVLSLLYKSDNFQSLSKEEKLAYWINAYNAMTVDLILRNYPVKSIKEIKDPWKQRLWKLTDIDYNLGEIEHQILRKMNEPRIHFAIVCASVSCPKLQNKAFTASKLDEQLTNATREFLSDTSKNSIAQNNLELSKIFQWFSKDFKQNGSLIHFLNQYSNIKISEKAKIKFKDYNWNLNE